MMKRTELYADPNNVFLHDLVLASCRRHPNKIALVDASSNRRMTYAEYGETVEALARGLTRFVTFLGANKLEAQAIQQVLLRQHASVSMERSK